MLRDWLKTSNSLLSKFHHLENVDRVDRFSSGAYTDIYGLECVRARIWRPFFSRARPEHPRLLSLPFFHLLLYHSGRQPSGALSSFTSPPRPQSHLLPSNLHNSLCGWWWWWLSPDETFSFLRASKTRRLKFLNCIERIINFRCFEAPKMWDVPSADVDCFPAKRFSIWEPPK